MTALHFADEALVDALLIEVAGLVERLIDTGDAGAIDLRGLPLSPACLADLEQRLGRGEVTMQLDAAGRSEIHETAFPGVWWSRHADEAGRDIAVVIDVAAVPEIVRADPVDMVGGLARLPAATHVASFAIRRGR